MIVERGLRLMAGTFVLISLALGYWVVSHYWILFTAFVGLNLFQSGLTNWYPAMVMLRKVGAAQVATGQHSFKWNSDSDTTRMTDVCCSISAESRTKRCI